MDMAVTTPAALNHAATLSYKAFQWLSADLGRTKGGNWHPIGTGQALFQLNGAERNLLIKSPAHRPGFSGCGFGPFGLRRFRLRSHFEARAVSRNFLDLRFLSHDVPALFR